MTVSGAVIGASGRGQPAEASVCIPRGGSAGAPLQIQGLNIRPSTRSAPLAKKHASDEFISLCAKYSWLKKPANHPG